MATASTLRGRSSLAATIGGIARALGQTIAATGLGLAVVTVGACERRGAAVERPAGDGEVDPAAELEVAATEIGDPPALAIEGELDAFDSDETSEAGPRPMRRPIPEPKVTFASPSDLEERYRGRGWAATSAAGQLVVLEEDFKHLRAIDLADGSTRWRLKAQDEPNGRHDLYTVGGRVLLHAGNHLVIVDAARGRRLHEASAPFNGNDIGCRMTREGDACAYTCDCWLQVFDCATGADVGGGYRSHENHIYFDISEPHDTVCPIVPKLFGRVGDLTVVAVEDESGNYAAVGIDPKGDERWRVDGVVVKAGAMFATHVPVGMAADGSRCWFVDGGAVEVFDCATGGGRWRADLAADSLSTDVRWLADGGGRLWLASAAKGGGAVEVRAGDGRRIWAQTLGADEHAWPLGQPISGRHFARPGKLLLYDAARGRVAASLTIGAEAGLVDDPRGGLWLVDDGIVEYDAQAKVRRRSPRGIKGLTRLTEDHLLVRTGDHQNELRRRDDNSPSLRIDGILSDLDLDGLGRETFVFYLHREEGAGTILAVGPRRRAKSSR